MHSLLSRLPEDFWKNPRDPRLRRRRPDLVYFLDSFAVLKDEGCDASTLLQFLRVHEAMAGDNPRPDWWPHAPWRTTRGLTAFIAKLEEVGRVIANLASHIRYLPRDPIGEALTRKARQAGAVSAHEEAKILMNAEMIRRMAEATPYFAAWCTYLKGERDRLAKPGNSPSLRSQLQLALLGEVKATTGQWHYREVATLLDVSEESLTLLKSRNKTLATRLSDPQADWKRLQILEDTARRYSTAYPRPPR